MDTRLSDALADRYRIERELGAGGMATVYLESAVAIAAAADAFAARAGVVVEHPMDPGVVGRVESLKASIPERKLDGLLVDAVTLTPAAVLAMVAPAQLA